MTNHTKIMFTRFVMMALAVIMILGVATPASAGPVDWIRGTEWGKETEEELKEKADEKFEQALGVKASFLFHAKAFFFDGKVLNLPGYTKEGKGLIDLLFLALILYRYRRAKDMKTEDVVWAALISLLIALALSTIFEACNSYPDYRQAGRKVYLTAFALPFVALLWRSRSLKGAKIALEGGFGSLMAYMSPVTNDGNVQIQEAVEAALSGDTATEDTPVVTDQAPSPEPAVTEHPAPAEAQNQPARAAAPAVTAQPAPAPVATPAPVVTGPVCPQCQNPLGAHPGKFCTFCSFKLVATAVPTSAPVPMSVQPAASVPRVKRNAVDDLFLV